MLSSDIAMSVRGLSKSYTIVHGQQRRPTFRDLLMDRLRNPFKRSAKETFWALKDVSFDIKKGEVVGIIGRNGAGKSTLLKILSRITEPTGGEIDLYGRVGSLLEVGTGFHPELTGRENIFLNGAILGMNRAEIRRQFDAIVDFAEVEKFLDTPVKRYSSGMYVRLAFAVAAHLDPEILIVDEVLAVGDAQFQAKCLSKMEQVSRGGRTVLLVSHNVGTIRTLCTRAVLLCAGMVGLDGPAAAVVEQYMARGGASANRWRRTEPQCQSQRVWLECASARGGGDETAQVFDSASPFEITIQVGVMGTARNLQVAVRVTNSEGVAVFTTASTDASRELQTLSEGSHRFRVEVPGNLLLPGKYLLTIAAINPGVELFDVLDGKVSFVIEDVGSHATALRDGRIGIVAPLLDWSSEKLSRGQSFSFDTCGSQVISE